jgi:hypothetical protein
MSNSNQPYVRDAEDNIQLRANLLATRLRKIAANLEDEVATAPENVEGCSVLEQVLGAESLVQEFLEWYYSDKT